jgi:hypothetical protein
MSWKGFFAAKLKWQEKGPLDLSEVSIGAWVVTPPYRLQTGFPHGKGLSLPHGEGYDDERDARKRQ